MFSWNLAGFWKNSTFSEKSWIFECAYHEKWRFLGILAAHSVPTNGGRGIFPQIAAYLAQKTLKTLENFCCSFVFFIVFWVFFFTVFYCFLNFFWCLLSAFFCVFCCFFPHQSLRAPIEMLPILKKMLQILKKLLENVTNY